MPAYNTELDRFAGYDAQVVGISVDSIPSHIAWQKKEIGTLDFPLCSDFFPHGRVAQLFGILRVGPPVPGVSERAVFVVDKEGISAMGNLSPISELPEIADVWQALKKLP